jgi:heme-degrading monooxygenase HmoA
VGHWTVKPGHEEAFVAGWHAMSAWTNALFPDAVGTLLRDRDAPTQFISFGSWPDEQTVAQWRGQPEFGAHVADLNQHLEDFRPGTFDVA